MYVTPKTHREVGLYVPARGEVMRKRGAVARAVHYDDAPGLIDQHSNVAGVISVGFAIGLGMLLWAGFFRVVGIL